VLSFVHAMDIVVQTGVPVVPLAATEGVRASGRLFVTEKNYIVSTSPASLASALYVHPALPTSCTISRIGWSSFRFLRAPARSVAAEDDLSILCLFFPALHR
jgi:hypothetical protein